MKKVDNYVRFMVDNGLIFEINRKVLHPLGLALDIGIHPDNSKWLAIRGLVSVEDGDDEGFIFDGETFDVGSERYKIYLSKTGQKKLDARQASLGYIVQEKSSGSIIDFHSGIGRDSAGRSINEYFNFSVDQMENIHDYVQWAFPNREPSSVNRDAPILTDEDVEFFKGQDHHVARLYIWFYDFLESKEHNNIFGQSANHNHLRITRVLKFLTETENHILAEKLYDYCVKSAKVDLSLSISYWKEALGIQDEL